MNDDHEPAPPTFTNRTSDLQISAAEKLQRFQCEGDALGALSWRVQQIGNLLDNLGRSMRERDPRWQRQPNPPHWGDVREVSGVLASLGDLAAQIGLYRDRDEAKRLLGLDTEDER